MLWDEYVRITLEGDPSLGEINWNELFLFFKIWLICVWQLIKWNFRWIYCYVKAKIRQRKWLVHVRCLSAYIQARSDFSYYSFVFKKNGPYIIVSNATITAVIGLTYIVTIFGMLYTICSAVGNFKINAEDSLFLDKREKKAKAWEHELTLFYGPKREWSLEFKYYNELARIASADFDGNYNEVYYNVADFEDSQLEDVEGVFIKRGYPTPWYFDDIDDWEIEEEWLDWCRGIDYNADNITKMDAMWGEMLGRMVKLYKKKIPLKNKDEVPEIQKTELVMNKLVQQDILEFNEEMFLKKDKQI